MISMVNMVKNIVRKTENACYKTFTEDKLNAAHMIIFV